MFSSSNPPMPLDVPSSSSSSSRSLSIIFVLISIITLILEIVSFTQPWWPDGITPFAVKSGDRYVPVEGCSIDAAGYGYYRLLTEQADCSSYNAVKAFILLAHLAGVACTLLILICMCAPSCRLRLPLRALSVSVAITMIAAFVFNIIAMSVYVGNEMRKQSNYSNYYYNRYKFPWEAGFILLLVEVVFQAVLCLLLFHTVRSLQRLKQNLTMQQPQAQSLYAPQQQHAYQQPAAYQQPQYAPPQPHFQPAYQQPPQYQQSQYQPAYQPPQPFVNPAPALASAPGPLPYPAPAPSAPALAPPSADAGVFVPIPGSNAYVYYPPGQSPAGAQQHVQAIQTQMQTNAPTPM